MTGKELQEKLAWRSANAAAKNPEQIAGAEEFCRGYKEFLDRGKTERECVKAAVEMLKAAGYSEIDFSGSYKPGDKVFHVIHEKSILITTFGQNPISGGVRINGAHIDSPRLDLKPNPLYEKDETALFKTHYYGGIRKYQWATIPLAMHGVIVRKDGEKIELNLGEDPDDPMFCVTDLLPHLSREQDERPLKTGIKAEELNIVVGSVPYADEDVKEPVKLKALEMLYERYGITEADFMRAEIEFVPAHRACDVGFDRSMIGAYGQDDRVCAYTALMAEISCKNPPFTTVTVLTDKEEIGSQGNTGADSNYLYDYISYLADMEKADLRAVLANSCCLSADVNAAFDPTFPQVSDPNNSCHLNHGCVLTKYTGSGGKSGASDACAEYMAKVIRIMGAAGVCWQTGEIGAVDMGGGGTIAKFIARLNISVVDLGVPVLSMHAPFELTAKMDVYHTYKAFSAFLASK